MLGSLGQIAYGQSDGSSAPEIMDEPRSVACLRAHYEELEHTTDFDSPSNDSGSYEQLQARREVFENDALLYELASLLAKAYDLNNFLSNDEIVKCLRYDLLELEEVEWKHIYLIDKLLKRLRKVIKGKRINLKKRNLFSASEREHGMSCWTHGLQCLRPWPVRKHEDDLTDAYSEKPVPVFNDLSSLRQGVLAQVRSLRNSDGTMSLMSVGELIDFAELIIITQSLREQLSGLIEICERILEKGVYPVSKDIVRQLENYL